MTWNYLRSVKPIALRGARLFELLWSAFPQWVSGSHQTTRRDASLKLKTSASNSRAGLGIELLIRIPFNIFFEDTGYGQHKTVVVTDKLSIRKGPLEEFETMTILVDSHCFFYLERRDNHLYLYGTSIDGLGIRIQDIADLTKASPVVIKIMKDLFAACMAYWASEVLRRRHAFESY